MSKAILDIGKEQVPYFRNASFSQLLKESKKLLLKLVNAPKGSNVIFLTSSGTGAMEAAVINLLDNKDKAIIINGGGFGQRFVEICSNHNIPLQNIIVNRNEKIDFDSINTNKANAFIVNAHETSTGRLYDLNKIGQFCQKNKLLNIVDAISAFVCDEVNMKKQHIDALILSSNKGLALPPGLAMVVLTPKAINRIKDIPSMYFNFKSYLSNIKRGQTPFTPAVSIIKQLHYRLKELDNLTIKESVKSTEVLARYFRKNIKHLPLKPYLQQMSNAMTSLTPTDNKKADEIIEDFEKRYNIILTPIGGDLKHKLIRVAHMGDMDIKYMNFLIKKLNHYYKCR